MTTYATPATRIDTEDVRAPMIVAGDMTPAGRVARIDYYGTIGVTLTLDDGRTFHRGLDDIVSRANAHTVCAHCGALLVRDYDGQGSGWHHIYSGPAMGSAECRR